MTKHSIIFFGNEQLAQGLKRIITPSFELVAKKHRLCALILPSKNPKKPFPIELIAKQHDCPIYYTKDPQEILDIIQKYQADLGVLASFGQIIPQSIINAFPLGILNIHPSLLPKYRGTTPIESAILNDDRSTGVSIMELAQAMDAGPILAQKSINLTEDISKQSLYEQLSILGSRLLDQVLSKTQEELAAHPRQSQDESQASFTKPLHKKLSTLESAHKSAAELSREIRAYLNFPKSKLSLFDMPCTITQASVSTTPKTILDPLCSDGSYLHIERLIPPGRKEMSAADFLRGHHKT